MLRYSWEGVLAAHTVDFKMRSKVDINIETVIKISTSMMTMIPFMSFFFLITKLTLLSE